jgi:hypothetical protein
MEQKVRVDTTSLGDVNSTNEKVPSLPILNLSISYYQTSVKQRRSQGVLFDSNRNPTGSRQRFPVRS